MANSTWVPHFWHFISGVWETVKAWNSATTFSLVKEIVLLPLVVFFAAAVLQIGGSFWRPSVLRTKGSELLKALCIGVGGPLAILGLVFLGAINFSIYYDHEGLVGTIRNLKQQNGILVRDRDNWKAKAAIPRPAAAKTIAGKPGFILSQDILELDAQIRRFSTDYETARGDVDAKKDFNDRFKKQLGPQYSSIIQRLDLIGLANGQLRGLASSLGMSPLDEINTLSMPHLSDLAGNATSIALLHPSYTELKLDIFINLEDLKNMEFRRRDGLGLEWKKPYADIQRRLRILFPMLAGKGYGVPSVPAEIDAPHLAELIAFLRDDVMATLQ